MCNKDNIVQLFGEDKKPSPEYVALYDMAYETLKRVAFLEQIIKKTICTGKGKCRKESEC